MLNLALAPPRCWAEQALFDTRHFTIFRVPDFLPHDLFDDLRATFPVDAPYKTHATGDKRYLDNHKPGFKGVLRSRPAWSGLYDYFSSPETAAELGRFCAPYLRYRPATQQRPWELVAPPGSSPTARLGRRMRRAVGLAPPSRDDAETTRVYVGFELSILHDGARIPPHTDTPTKLVSLMLYFPSSEQQDLPLGTQFYWGRNGSPPWSGWRSDMPDDEETEAFVADHEVFLQPPFEPRTLVGFLKSEASWHGLPAVHPGPHGRRALVVNYYAA